MKLNAVEREELRAIAQSLRSGVSLRKNLKELPTFMREVGLRLDKFIAGERVKDAGVAVERQCWKPFWPSAYHYVKDAFCHVNVCKRKFSECKMGICPIATLRAYAAHDVDTLRHLREHNAQLEDALAPILALGNCCDVNEMAKAVNECLSHFDAPDETLKKWHELIDDEERRSL